MTPILIKLPDGNYVNPKHVVSITFREYGYDEIPPQTIMTTVVDSWTFNGDQREALTELLSNTKP